MLSWQTLILIAAFILSYVWPGSVRNELFGLGLPNRTEAPLAMRQQHDRGPTSYYWQLLLQLEHSECPFKRLLFHSLVVLPVYNLLLLLIGWRLNSSASSSANRIMVIIKPDPLPASPSVETSPLALPAPLPPPRAKRRPAPKPPQRRLRYSFNSNATYPRQKDALFGCSSCCYQDQYKSLRKNLQRVLEGLQQPLPMPLPSLESLSLRVPPLILPTPFESESPLLEETINSTQVPRDKSKPRKLFHSLFKQLGKRLAKRSRHMQDECRSNGNNALIAKKRGLWQRLGILYRPKHQQPAISLSDSSISTNSSCSCLYAK